ncbi:DNA replication regulator SLD3-domain-containing protein [Rhexocercosporidium sp. MPI-PUGE-AT-0058]|nr:DNA replication regulator SLD3-domain-containing protein [Rhexocercosporidium sp. MPI-PUGE-AT-0058]
MSSQIEAHVASTTRFGFLTPASDTALNPSDGVESGGKKRKRDGNTMEDLLRDKFVVRPYPSSGFVKPQSLQPLMLLPRSNLPLSSFDILTTAKGLANSRLFETHVKILELEERMGSQPTVLIARLDDTRILYAVERESRGLYVLLKIGSWVNLGELRAAAVASKQELPERASLHPSSNLPASAPETNNYSKKKRLAIEAIQSMVKRPSTGHLTESQSDSQISSVEPQTQPVFVDSPLPIEAGTSLPETTAQDGTRAPPAPVDDIAVQPTASDIFDNVRTHYLEALYLSKASLAYFAKGPLSRARAAFHLDYDSNLDLNDHIAFLESMVMSSTLLEKKYRDGVPTCVSLIDIHDPSADDAAQAGGKPKKKRTSKKMKPGKNGLYPTEEPLIRRWWATHDDDADTGAPGSSRDELTKSRISQLRIRETQLQMIVILEVLALQPLATSSEDIGGGLPAALPSTEVVGSKEKPAKSKKPDHLVMLIDVHIDRLCIWQSLALESINAVRGESQINSNTPTGISTQTKHTDNILRDFCVEVIAPFFQSRLPDRCAVINRKLGGPVVVSPPKPKVSKSSSFSGAPSRPGAATKRPVPVKPRQSLKRVLTDDRERRSMSRGPNKKIALMRSATMPIMPGLKREASEAPSLSSIPTAESQSLEASRGGVLNSRRFSRREVDLGSLLPEMSSKAKKQAIIDAELKEAISALKKPNRELAGKALAETAEKRSASSRKSKKPVRNPLFQGVQISATPKANRQRDMFAQQSQMSSLERMVGESSMIPASSIPRIPQSVSRSSGGGHQNNPLLSHVQATPTRKAVPAFPRRSMAEMDFGGIPSSPLHVRWSSAQLFTAVPDSAVKNTSAPLSYGVDDTPIKKRPASSLGHGHPSMASFGSDKENDQLERKAAVDVGLRGSIGSSKDESIYKALGWDDNDDIDDLA